MTFLNGTKLKPYLIYSGMAALIYCLPLIFFLKAADYSSAWMLYGGNFLFLLIVVFFVTTFNFKRDENAGSLAMFTASVITTVLGTIFAVILSLILLTVFVPGLFQPGVPEKVLLNEPAQIVDGKTDGLIFMVIANAIIGNTACGMFVSIIFPFTLKGDQTKEKVPTRKQAEL
jgi:predicted membrane protein